MGGQISKKEDILHKGGHLTFLSLCDTVQGFFIYPWQRGGFHKIFYIIPWVSLGHPMDDGLFRPFDQDMTI